MTTRTPTGTVKAGRWTYPAYRAGVGPVSRNTKRDGSGEWELADPKVADTYVADDRASDLAAVAIPGFVDEAPANHDRDDLKVAYQTIYANFAASLDEVASAIDSNPGRAKAAIATLVHLGLVAEGEKTNGEGEVLWQCWKTYDELDEKQADAEFEGKIRITSVHGGKVGAQTKKPGRSSWAVGDKCPQGHVLEEGDVYTQPSGRKQCRKCRGGYVSNAPKSA